MDLVSFLFTLEQENSNTVKLEHSYTHRGFTVEIFSNKEAYSSLIFMDSKSPDWKKIVSEEFFFSCLEEAIEASDEWIDELCINHN